MKFPQNAQLMLLISTLHNVLSIVTLGELSHLLLECNDEHVHKFDAVLQNGNLEVNGNCCCKLNNTLVYDEHLFGQVSTRTGRYQLLIFRCTNVHL